MNRADISKDLVHWVRGASDHEAFNTLRKIVFGQRLLGGNELIKGGHNCICFTEAPESTFHNVLSRYRPFGIRVSKKWLFGQGGRPVIYQTDSEFSDTSKLQQWRHVRYEPDKNPPVDFSWEREWRIKTDELELPSGEVRVLVPDSSYMEELKDEHFKDEVSRIYWESLAYGDAWLFNEPQDFYYAISVVDL